MMRARGALILFFAVATIGVVGCSPNPKADCESACEEQRSRMCNGYTGDENCTALCATAQADYDSVTEDARRIGCGSEWDAAYGCSFGGDPCNTSRCNAEGNALQSCITSYCTRNPEDRVCAGP
ncbi:MAG: hypothetical protein KC619_08935 [Myxococcales bacterium]|nr:hypothetical protein [Myxococcales bacterium]